ncbi:MAG: signal peptidase II [Thermosediminibacteraceae bacterium]|nr:signal peptidase II [Thermosediminibacteraceae bacterium]
MGAWIIAAFIFVIDQFTKTLVKTRMVPHQSIEVIDNILYLTYVRNTGAAFSLLKGKVFFFIVVSFIVIAALVFYMKRLPPEKKILKVTLSLILGGALGNLVDRLRYGYVVDFIDFRIWPVFNVADSAMVIGVIILVYLIIVDPEVIKSFE